MKITIKKEELIKVEGDGFFNNELCVALSEFSNCNMADTLELEGFTFSDVGEVLDIIGSYLDTGDILFTSGSIVVVKSENKISVPIRS